VSYFLSVFLVVSFAELKIISGKLEGRADGDVGGDAAEDFRRSSTCFLEFGDNKENAEATMLAVGFGVDDLGMGGVEERICDEIPILIAVGLVTVEGETLQGLIDVEGELEEIAPLVVEASASGTFFPETPDGMETAVMTINTII